jgi:CRP-like cAMP-binding protein
LEEIPRQQRTLAKLTCTVRETVVGRGPWEPDLPLASGPGILVVDGLLCRRVRQENHFAAELIGPGDFMCPQVDIADWATIESESRWQVLHDCRLALLDGKFATKAAPFPGVSTALIKRALLRSRYLAVMLAIAAERRLDARLNMFLWHLADRFGRRRNEWVEIPLPLTHAILGELVAARRPSVTAGLAQLTEEGKLRRAKTGWQLRGDARPAGVTPAGVSSG